MQKDCKPSIELGEQCFANSDKIKIMVIAHDHVAINIEESNSVAKASTFPWSNFKNSNHQGVDN
jgi:hypothetical protein